ncbi:copia LTR rider, partial [Trifolium pratense]
RKLGIKRHRTVAYTPQQNGLAERMNMTLLEQVRCMLLRAGLPKRFWGEAVNTAAYLINRCPSTRIDLKTPMEVWSGRPVDYSNLKVFGALAFAHVKQDKLDARAIKCVFIGYPEDSNEDEVQRLEKRPETGVEKIQFKVEPSTDERENEDETQVPEESGSGETTVPDYQLARDREMRVIKPSNRFGYADLICYALNADEEVQDSEPKNFREALESIDRVKTPRYKARLVEKGFTQVEGIDYNEIFSPVVKHCSIRVLMAIVNMYDIELEQMDVKTAFLHRDLEETIYMQQPEGFVEDNSKVCLLKKSLYGLKQSPRQWYHRFDDFLLKTEFVRSNYDSCVYMMKRNEKMILYLLLYVDDILMASSDKHEIQKLKEKLNGEFEMKNPGNAKRILGMDILRDRSKGDLFLSHHDYLKKVVERFRMTDSKVMNTPLDHHSKLSIKQCPQSEDERKKMESTPFASGVGSIMYDMVCSRPDLSYAISVVSWFMANPGQVHWQALKWVLRYLNGSLKGGLKYKRTDPGRDALEGCVDSDYAGNIDNRKSLSGFVFTLFGTTVTWKANQQSVVALSTTQAEYIALVEGVKEAKVSFIWQTIKCIMKGRSTLTSGCTLLET